MDSKSDIRQCSGSHALIDNATILNACSVLERPGQIDAVAFRDLVSFVESALLFDHLHTLIGRSFSYSLKPTSAEPWDVRNTHNFYRSIREFHLLRPQAINASWQSYRLENLEVADSIARRLNIDQLVEDSSSRYPNGLPWGKATFGVGAVGDDSWPIYCFEGLGREADASSTGSSPASRRRLPHEIFVSQTYYYVVASWLMHMPLVVSSLRKQLVEGLVESVGLDYRGPDTDLIATVDAAGKDSMNLIASTFPSQQLALDFPPLFTYVLSKCRNGREELLLRILEVRDEARFRAFRNWTGQLTVAAQSGNIGQIVQASREIEKIKAASKDLSGGSSSIIAKIVFQPKVTLQEMTEKGLAKMIDRLSKPHLILLSDLERFAITDSSGIDEFERVFGVAPDLTLLQNPLPVLPFETNAANLRLRVASGCWTASASRDSGRTVPGVIMYVRFEWHRSDQSRCGYPLVRRPRSNRDISCPLDMLYGALLA